MATVSASITNNSLDAMHQTAIVASTNSAIKLDEILDVSLLAFALTGISNVYLEQQATFMSFVAVDNDKFVYRQSDCIALAEVTVNPATYYNYPSPFARFFGANARQDATKIYLKKSDFGLSDKDNHTAECLLVALLLRVMYFESAPSSSDVVIEHLDTRFSNGLVSKTLVLYLYSLLTYQYGIEIINATDPISPERFK